jgi:hypothetical protein
MTVGRPVIKDLPGDSPAQLSESPAWVHPRTAKNAIL